MKLRTILERVDPKTIGVEEPRPDGMLQLVPSSRFTKQPELIAPYEVTTPLWAAHTIVINPKQPRTEEANGTEAAHLFVSVVGAAWLLMGRPGVTGDPLDRRRAATSMISGDLQWTSSHPYDEGG